MGPRDRHQSPSFSARDVYAQCIAMLLAPQPTSRNKHFEAYRDPRTKKVLALYRRLRALVVDLEAYAARDDMTLLVTSTTYRGRPSVRLELVGRRTRRTAWLERPAWDAVRMHAAARAAIDTLQARPRHNGNAAADRDRGDIA